MPENQYFLRLKFLLQNLASGIIKAFFVKQDMEWEGGKEMDVIRNCIRSTVAALTFGVAGLSFATTATALATYEGLAELELTLSSVTNVSGTPVSTGWSVNFDGFSFDEDARSFGDASVSETAIVPGIGSMAAGDTILQSSTSMGSATNGLAESFAFTSFYVGVSNAFSEDLTFTFDYTAAVAATVTSGSSVDDAYVYARIDILDDLRFINILLDVEADVLSGPPDDSRRRAADTVSFTLAPSKENVITGYLIDTYGFAGSVAVPVPATLALLSLGLVGIGYGRRR